MVGTLCVLPLQSANAIDLEVLNWQSVKSDYKRVGQAKFTFLFWDIYNSTLYTKSGSFEGSHKQGVIYNIEYLRDITSADLIKATKEQWQHLKVNESQYKTFLPKLKLIWPDIKAGDSLTLHVMDGVSVFYFNDEKVGTIGEKEFGKLFLDIWLSPDTSEPKLRKKLLGVTTNE